MRGFRYIPMRCTFQGHTCCFSFSFRSRSRSSAVLGANITALGSNSISGCTFRRFVVFEFCRALSLYLVRVGGPISLVVEYWSNQQPDHQSAEEGWALRGACPEGPSSERLITLPASVNRCGRSFKTRLGEQFSISCSSVIQLNGFITSGS